MVKCEKCGHTYFRIQDIESPLDPSSTLQDYSIETLECVDCSHIVSIIRELNEAEKSKVRELLLPQK